MRDLARAAAGRSMDHAVSSVRPMSSLANQPASAANRDSVIAARVEQLYERHAALVQSICRSLLRDRVEAEDAAQQTFLSAQRALLNGSSPRDEAAWLATIARHESLARVQGRMREPLPMDVEEHETAPDAHAAAVRRHDAGELRDALAALPGQQREALLLREVRGFSYQEVAASLSVTTSAVESLLFRARRTLQARLQGSLAALSFGQWVQALGELAGRLGSGVAGSGAVKVAAVGISTAVVAGGAVVGPELLAPGHAPHAVRRATHTAARGALHAAASNPPVAFAAVPAPHPAVVGADSQREISDVKSTDGTQERKQSSETTDQTGPSSAGGGAGERQSTSDGSGTLQTSTTDGARTETTDGSRTGTTDTNSTSASPGVATTSPDPATPDD